MNELSEFDKSIIADALIDRIAKLSNLSSSVALPETQEAVKKEIAYHQQLLTKITSKN